MAVYKDRAFNGIGGNELQQIGKLFEIRRNKQEKEMGEDQVINQTISFTTGNDVGDDCRYNDLVESTANVNINISIESDKDLDMIDKVYERLHKIREMYDNQD